MTTRRKLVRDLDKEFSLFIRKRDKACVLCQSRKNLTCGHLFSRIAYSTRWSELNCHAQCAGCNLRHEHQPDIFIRWFIRKFGLGEYEALAFEYHQIKKWTNTELATLLAAVKLKRTLQ